MRFDVKRIDWNTLLPLLCVGYLAGVISIVLPLLETVMLAVGIGALTGAIMRYCKSQHRGDS